MQDYLKKAIKLAKKTGDRVIIVDSANSEDAFVVMGLDEYENLIIGKSEVRGLTEDELLDKINRDIAIWKTDNDEDKFDGWTETKDIIDNQYLSNNKPDFTKSYDDHKDSFDFSQDDLSLDEDDDTFYYEDAKDDLKIHSYQDDLEGIDKSKPRKNSWKISTEIKEGAEEVI